MPLQATSMSPGLATTLTLEDARLAESRSSPSRLTSRTLRNGIPAPESAGNSSSERIMEPFLTSATSRSLGPSLSPVRSPSNPMAQSVP